MKEGYVHLYSGSTEFGQDYYGDAYKEPWLSETDENGDVNYNKVPDTDYLTFRITSGGNIYWKASSNCPNNFKRTIEYSKNAGAWTSVSPNATISVVAGDNVRFRGNNPSYGGSDVPYPERSEDYGLIYYNSFEGSTCGFEVYGNIMSLIDKDNFRTLVHFSETLVFYRLFYNCSKLTSAENLLFPATRLTDECYSHVFMNCTGMTGVPSFESTRLGKWCYDGAFENTGIVDASGIVLKARIMNEGCYQGMFCNNPRLRALPVIKAKKLAYRCFYFMFGSCPGLADVPSNYLPWKTLADSCYDRMFIGTAVTRIPDLPAKKLETGCYRYMFSQCTNLTGKINLSATILANDCYQFMFYAASAGTVNTPEVFIAGSKLKSKSFEHLLTANKSINKIICLATDISAENSTANFTYLLASNGLFVKHPDMPVGVAGGWTRGPHGIPNNWSYEDATYTDKKSIHLEMDGIEGVEFTVTSHLPWRFVSEVPWITAVPAAGESGTTHCTVYAEPASESRTGNLGIVTDYYAIRVGVVQNSFNKPLTFNILTSGNVVWSASSASIAKTIEYRINDDAEWTSVTATVAGVSIPVQAGDVVEFRGDNATYAAVQYGTVNDYNSFTNSDCTFNVGGNIFSLVNSTGYTSYADEDTLPTGTSLARLFYNCTALKDVSELHLNTKRTSEAAFTEIFLNCAAITTPPTIKTQSLRSNCYQGMFKNCTNLTTVPDLPVTSVASGCYASMFQGCTKLTSIHRILPAATLVDWCYASMYEGCTRITTAPELPAKALLNSCYYQMFSGCTALNYVKCLATAITATDCTANWLAGVAATGLFEENEVYTNWTLDSPSGIPTGWEIQGSNPAASVKSIFTSGGTETVTVSAHTSWTATTSDDWITLSPTTGGRGTTNVSISFTGTPTGGYREGSVQFGDGDEVKIHQYALPAGYTAVTCISSTASGGQWIDLGIKMFETSPVSFNISGRMKLTGPGIDAQSVQSTIINSLEEVSPWPGFCVRQDDQDTSKVRWTGYPFSSKRDLATIGAVFDFDVASTTAGSGTHNVTTTLFCSRDGEGNPFRFAEGSIYNLYIKSYNTELYLLPCVDVNNEGGLYEVISGTFFTSLGENPFTYTA